MNKVELFSTIIHTNSNNYLYQIAIIGGGLAGLASSILLRKAGFRVFLIEKNSYPHHKVCGEYVSNEVKPFLLRNELFPSSEILPEIDTFILSSVSGKTAKCTLDLGGFGISRHTLDHFLYQKARSLGVEFHLNKQAKNISLENDHYTIQLSDGNTLDAMLVIGAHGKRSIIDKALNRNFLKKRSGYIGVKYHVKTDQATNTIALHNFHGGYCGVSKVDGGVYNLCYLGQREHLRKYGSIKEMESNVLFQNPHLKSLFKNSDFLFSEPLVINEFSFQKKKAVENGVLMAGDAAGLITPLCGNGMALAIHSAKILSEILMENYSAGKFKRKEIFNSYEKEWNRLFAYRLWAGRKVQQLFGSKLSSELAVWLMRHSAAISRQIIKNTHGKVF